MVLEEYTWIFALTVIFAFLTAVGIGANDMANSFATTVGSRALTLGQVVIVASICEFSGAVLLGSGVTSTIKSGVADLDKFVNTPDLIMYGFLAVSMTTAFWDITASLLGLPVSMTHTTVGAVVGMALALRGGSAVIWSEEKDEFPFIGGMVPIFLSWVVSPLICGIITVILFFFIRQFVLRSPNSFIRAFYTLPLLVGGIAWLIASFIIQTGSDNETWKEYDDSFAVWVGAVCGVGCALFTLLVVMPILRKKINLHEQQTIADAESAATHAKNGTEPEAEEPKASWTHKIPAPIRNNPITRALFFNINKESEIHDMPQQDHRVAAMYAHAEVFDVKTESMFRYLQVFSACVMSFTHGANDVSNAMGPFAAVWQIWKSGEVGSSNPTPEWILVIGGVGISIGLATLGWRVIRTLGVETVRITNARGFCAELATAITVAIASRYGLPISTTMTLTGGLIGVGIMEGLKGINWRALIRIMFGWVLTLFVACGVAAAITAYGVYSPNKNASDDADTAAQTLNITNTAALTQLYTSVGPSNTGALADINALNTTFYDIFSPSIKDIDSIANVTAAIFQQFNETLVQ